MAHFVSEKIRRERVRAEQVKALLNQHNQKYKGKPNKKLDADQILKIVPNITKLKDFWIRDPQEWTAKSFNMERQIVDFASWLLCEYSVPFFMYKVFDVAKIDKYGYVYQKTKDPLTETYLDWFVTMGQGMSFRKASKDFLSKKEAGLFLAAPREYSIAGNILWAKCKAHNISSPIIIHDLCTYWYNRYNNKNKSRWDSIVNFYSRYPEIDSNTMHDTLDFLNSAFERDKNFTLSGRTLNSIIQLTNEWHTELQQQKGIKHSTWEGLDIPDWQWEVKKDVDVWYITQIRDSKKLFHEGKTMHHCVGGYVNRCIAGNVGIFTMSRKQHSIMSKALTIEVDSRHYICQTRGNCNRSPIREEINVLSRWAAERDVRFIYGNRF